MKKWRKEVPPDAARPAGVEVVAVQVGEEDRVDVVDGDAQRREPARGGPGREAAIDEDGPRPLAARLEKDRGRVAPGAAAEHAE